MSEIYERTLPFTLERAEDDGDGLTLSGYAAVFNTPTRIQDHHGEYDEVIAPGAFKRTTPVCSSRLACSTTG
jgi:phage head maturation protease